MANPFVHVELHTKDLEKAKQFYTALFGWKLSDMPMPGGGSYTLIEVGEGTGGGMFQNPDPNVPPNWLAYVGVDDVAASTQRARARRQDRAGRHPDRRFRQDERVAGSDRCAHRAVAGVAPRLTSRPAALATGFAQRTMLRGAHSG